MKKVIIFSCLLAVIACTARKNAKISEKDKALLDSSAENFRTKVFDKEFKDTTIKQ